MMKALLYYGTRSSSRWRARRSARRAGRTSSARAPRSTSSRPASGHGAIVVACTEVGGSPAVRPLVVARLRRGARAAVAVSQRRAGARPARRRRGGPRDHRRGVQALVKYDRLLGFAAGSESAGGAIRRALRAGAAARRTSRPASTASRRPIERLGIAYSVPDWLVELVRSELGEAAPEVALAPDERACRRASRG